MRILPYGFLLSLAATLTASSHAQQLAFPPQGSLKLERKSLPLTDGPAFFNAIPPGDARPRLSQVIAGNSVRIMSPDHMPCLVPDLGRLEKMPIRRLRPSQPHDRMPIDPGSSDPAQRPRIRVIPNP